MLWKARLRSLTHSCAVCIVKACSLVETFNSLPGTGGKELQDLLLILEGFGVDGARAFRCVTHDAHVAWKQTDGSACGVFCALIIASLVRGLRIRVLQYEMEKWRAYLHAEVVKKGNSIITS